MVKLGLMRNVVLGRNSPVISMMPVERMVLVMSSRASLSSHRCSQGLMMAENEIP